MPKMKTHKSTKKRFKVTGRGKLRRRQQGSSHLRRKKSKRAKRKIRKDLPLDSANLQRIERLLGRSLEQG